MPGNQIAIGRLAGEFRNKIRISRGVFHLRHRKQNNSQKRFYELCVRLGRGDGFAVQTQRITVLGGSFMAAIVLFLRARAFSCAGNDAREPNERHHCRNQAVKRF